AFNAGSNKVLVKYKFNNGKYSKNAPGSQVFIQRRNFVVSEGFRVGDKVEVEMYDAGMKRNTFKTCTIIGLNKEKAMVEYRTNKGVENTFPVAIKYLKR
ncbi:MAG: hypothetical protein H7Y04_15735, partial [Verrucomicrobia bacterium]|nr:hypothetical protein [Cytophagales bacterium]